MITDIPPDNIYRLISSCIDIDEAEWFYVVM